MKAKQILETMADLESRIAVIYERFAARFCDASDVSDLWASMGREELHHADLLSRAAASLADTVVPQAVAVHVSKLQQVVTGHEQNQAHMTLQDALQATADLEEAEADHLHASLAELGDSARPLLENPAMQHRLRGLLEHAVELFGTPALRQRMAWRRFRD